MFRNAKEHFDVGIINVPLKEGENGYLPFVGKYLVQLYLPFLHQYIVNIKKVCFPYYRKVDFAHRIVLLSNILTMNLRLVGLTT